jgi:hypothetical protein
MADSILTEATKKIRDAIRTERDSATSSFELTTFELDYDYDGRDVEGGLQEGVTYVTCVVPQSYLYVGRISEGTIGRVAAFDIDIREKFGVGQQLNAGQLEKDQIDRVIRLGEQIHLLWSGLEAAGTWLELPVSKLQGEWIAAEREVEGVSDRNKSQHLIAYHEPILSEQRIIYGMCREVFMLTGDLP